MVTWLSLVGCPGMMMIAAKEGVVASNARWAALWTSLIVFWGR